LLGFKFVRIKRDISALANDIAHSLFVAAIGIQYCIVYLCKSDVQATINVQHSNFPFKVFHDVFLLADYCTSIRSFERTHPSKEYFHVAIADCAESMMDKWKTDLVA
jgi:hypothetical protein